MKIRASVWYALFVSAFFALLFYSFFPGLHFSKISERLQPYTVMGIDFLWLMGSLFLLSVLSYVRWGWKAYAQGTPSTTHSRVLVDRPIASARDDAFRREHTAKVLAQELVLPPERPSVVLALEGPWGCGKSSLLTMVEEELRKFTPQPVVVHFNPWILGTVDDLLDRFFRQLSEESARQGAAPALVTALDGMRREVERDRIDGITRLVIQVWQTAAGILREPKSRRDFLSRKEGISSLLDRLDRPVVVLVDDVDRLAPDQIRAVFQLVKTVGDFNRVSYLIAYDPAPVYAALDHQWDGYGKEYKDKIVQVTVPFPSHPLSEREAYLRSTWNKAAAAWGVTMPAHHQALFEQAIPVILRSIHTPRHVKIVVNETFLRAGLTKAEIAMPDLLAFAALGTRFPQIISIIRNRPSLVARRTTADADMLSSISGLGTSAEKEDPIRAEVAKVLPDPLEAEQAEAILAFLFPVDDQVNAGMLGRLREENNLLLMLYGGITESIFSNAEVEKFLYSPSERESILDARQIDGTVTGFLLYARSGVSPTLPIPEMEQLAETLVLRSASLYREHRANLTSEFSRFVLHLLLRSGSKDEAKHQTLRRVVFDARFLSLGHELLVRLFRYVGAWQNGKWSDRPYVRRGSALDWISDDQVDALREEWLDVVALCPIDLLISRETQPIGILHRRAQFANDNYGDVQTELTAWLDTDQKNVHRFAELFPLGVSFSGTEHLVGPEYDLVAAFKLAGVDFRRIERLQEDCPILGNRTMEPSAPSADVQEVDLSLPVTYESLATYSLWKFPGKPVSDRIQKLLLRDLNMQRYPTLQQINEVVQRAADAVQRYSQEHPEWFKFGTDYITKSLGFVDNEFRAKHGFASKTRGAFNEYATLMKPQPSQ